MGKPFVSVIIPTYNRPLFLSELIESLFRQTFKDFEIIIVNDNGDKVDFVKDLYPELEIEVLEMERNEQHVQARNRGVTHSKGEFILLCDDDDLLLPGHLKRMIKEIKNCDLVYSDAEIFDYTIENNIRVPGNRFLFAYEHEVEEMKKFSTFVPSGCLYRRSIHEEVGFFDPEMFNYWDWDFYLRVSERFLVKRVPVASTLYAFSPSGDHLSGNLKSRRFYLDQLSRKHNLGDLPVTNFFLMLEEPEVKARQAATDRVWDGQPVLSRLVNKNATNLLEQLYGGA
ncbi:glycosyltransferase family 2 protein [Effusibacillus consociatus]|uniref:Glycosyltransferase family 2 protein n=1 Tax=Effusibacillus consociatus TaxID=1117041 RepID=A0ABV9PZX4_9BACL